MDLQLEIEALRRKAQALRKDEAAHAVRWIREAITKHGIDAAELGLQGVSVEPLATLMLQRGTLDHW